MSKFKKYLKKFYFLIIFIIIITIFLSSLINIYKYKNNILSLLKFSNHINHNSKEIINPLKRSDREIPPRDINNLKIMQGAEINGQWSAPIDWNIIPLHATLLPDETIMTFGSFSIEKKEGDTDTRANKKITVSDGRQFDRDGGSHQWEGHWVYSAIDFDIWDPKKGVGEDSHKLFKKPLVMDAFCSIVRVLDLNRVFILGGNKNIHKENMPDTQNKTMIYDIKEKKFESSKNLNLKRWYGSVVITGDEKMIMFGGKDITTDKPSITPEMIDLKKIDQGWELLDQSKSNSFFGIEIPAADEWSYPRTFLASDGNIVGISYNKVWVMDAKNNYRVFKTAEIPLIESGISGILEHSNPNLNDNKKENLSLLTISNPVGATNSAVMIDKDKVLIFGGKQTGKEYASSNKVFLLDFQNSFNPKITQLKSMKHARSNANATIMPDGNVFINGGNSLGSDDFKFNVFVPEIYNPFNQTTKELDEAYFRRNYHSTSLLLPDGRIWTGGGDVWNAEIFYPPYLFSRDFNNKTILAKRPKITSIPKEIKRGKIIDIEVDDNISRVTLISTGTTTHAQSSESKFREIKFSKIFNNKIRITIDNNPNNLQNGTYMLFVLNSEGVPSEGKIVLIN